MSRRILTLGYGVVAYLTFLGVFCYTIGWLADIGVPKSIDDGRTGPVWAAMLTDAGLLGLFAVQHSVMARPWFKRWWTRAVPPAVERSTYVLTASLVIAALMWQWRPLPDPVWEVSAGWAQALLWTLYAAGWAVLWSSAPSSSGTSTCSGCARRSRGSGRPPTPSRGSASRCSTASSGTRSWSASSSPSGRHPR
ncbi:hypothetical protein CS0771_47910 [Catellatospora sp. IY07-71]|nr:hypothetical protein CS0771_47910 [Catellatospora sp. IY07-71]